MQKTISLMPMSNTTQAIKSIDSCITNMHQNRYGD